MANITEQQVLDALKVVTEPEIGRDLVSLNMVKDVKLCGGQVTFKVELANPAYAKELKQQLTDACRQAVAAIPGVESVSITVGVRVHETFDRSQKKFAPGVKNFIVVASGKGGVGKSTVAMNLAAGLARTGVKVGLMDADIYGPSVPLLTGVRAKPSLENDKLQPITKFGIKLMSIGFVLEEGQAVVWRGPMVHGAIQQFLNQVEWGELDYLIIDMPPGTGDAQLTIVQSVPLTGAIIVSTPQELALIDAHKAIKMFRETKAEILGLVENMTHFNCPKCGHREDIFSTGGARRAAEELGVPFLGEIPIYTEIREGSDRGLPIMTTDKTDSPAFKAFEHLCQTVATEVSKRNVLRKPPKILPVVTGKLSV